jgi:hypothetical protein
VAAKAAIGAEDWQFQLATVRDGLNGPDPALMNKQAGFVNRVLDIYFRMEISGWKNLPQQASLLIGGHDTLLVVSEGRWLAKLLRLKKFLRSDVAPITLSFPFGIALHATPLQHIPLPAKIRTLFLQPVRFDDDPALADDSDYVQQKYRKVERCIQAGMDALAKRRKFPIFG